VTPLHKAAVQRDARLVERDACCRESRPRPARFTHARLFWRVAAPALDAVGDRTSR
jgi:hypothetical protein